MRDRCDSNPDRDLDALPAAANRRSKWNTGIEVHFWGISEVRGLTAIVGHVENDPQRPIASADYRIAKIHFAEGIGTFVLILADRITLHISRYRRR
jgi:hypothetical protein